MVRMVRMVMVVVVIGFGIGYDAGVNLAMHIKVVQ